jgi:hypothetical protein
MGLAARARAEASFPLERMGARIVELLERAGELHRTNPQPLPTETMARSSATETIELMRLAWLLDAVWGRHHRAGGLRGIGLSCYVFLRQIARPMYLWGIRRGWRWLPRLRDTLARVLAGHTA